MNIRITFKTPDALEHAINDAIEAEGEKIGNSEREEMIEEIKDMASRWIKYGECITVEIDTEEQTCVVKEL